MVADQFRRAAEAARAVTEKGAARLARDGKLPVRERIDLLFDTGYLRRRRPSGERRGR